MTHPELRLKERYGIQSRNIVPKINRWIRNRSPRAEFSYIWDGSGRLRTADKDERTALAGFPGGWLDGLSKTAVARVTGNAVVPGTAEQIFRAIKEAI